MSRNSSGGMSGDGGGGVSRGSSGGMGGNGSSGMGRNSGAVEKNTFWVVLTLVDLW